MTGNNLSVEENYLDKGASGEEFAGYKVEEVVGGKNDPDAQSSPLVAGSVGMEPTINCPSICPDLGPNEEIWAVGGNGYKAAEEDSNRGSCGPALLGSPPW